MVDEDEVVGVLRWLDDCEGEKGNGDEVAGDAALVRMP